MPRRGLVLVGRRGARRVQRIDAAVRARVRRDRERRRAGVDDDVLHLRAAERERRGVADRVEAGQRDRDRPGRDRRRVARPVASLAVGGTDASGCWLLLFLPSLPPHAASRSMDPMRAARAIMAATVARSPVRSICCAVRSNDRPRLSHRDAMFSPTLACALHGSGMTEMLLTHATWLRRLAANLVGEDADDLVQETWLAAVRRPPAVDRPVGPWLVRVMRNAARFRWRGDANRRAREQLVATEADSVTPTSEELLARHQLQQLLARLVGELADPSTASPRALNSPSTTHCTSASSARRATTRGRTSRSPTTRTARAQPSARSRCRTNSRRDSARSPSRDRASRRRA